MVSQDPWKAYSWMRAGIAPRIGTHTCDYCQGRHICYDVSKSERITNLAAVHYICATCLRDLDEQATILEMHDAAR